MEGFIYIDNILKHEGYMQSKGDQKSSLLCVPKICVLISGKVPEAEPPSEEHSDDV